MNAFDAMTDALFADPNLAGDGSAVLISHFTPAPAGPTVAVVAIYVRGAVDGPMLRSGFTLAAADQPAALFADIRRSQVALPKDGDGLVDPAGKAFKVRTEPTLDDLGRVWRLRLEAV